MAWSWWWYCQPKSFSYGSCDSGLGLDKLIWILKFSLPVVSIGNCVWSVSSAGLICVGTGACPENPDPLLSPCYHPSIPLILLWGLWFQAHHKARRRLENFLCDTNTYHIHVVSLCNRSPWDADVTRIIIMRVNYWCVALLQVVSAIKFTNEESVEKKIWKAEILDKSLTRHCSSPTG